MAKTSRDPNAVGDRSFQPVRFTSGKQSCKCPFLSAMFVCIEWRRWVELDILPHRG